MSEARIIVMVLLPLLCSYIIAKTNKLICNTRNKKKIEIKETNMLKDMFTNFFIISIEELFFMFVCYLATGQNLLLKDYKNELATIAIIIMTYIMFLFLYAIIKETPLYGGHIPLFLLICIVSSLVYGSYLSTAFNIEHANEPPLSYEYNIYKHNVLWSEIKQNKNGDYVFYYTEDASRVKSFDIKDENVSLYPTENDEVYILETVHTFVTRKKYDIFRKSKLWNLYSRRRY